VWRIEKVERGREKGAGNRSGWVKERREDKKISYPGRKFLRKNTTFLRRLP
jgi:hypothetical protein